MLCLFINNNEDTEIFKGKGLRLGGSSAIYEDNDTFFGDLSAIIIENMPFWADFSSAPSTKTALMSEWETKMDAIIAEVQQPACLQAIAELQSSFVRNWDQFATQFAPQLQRHFAPAESD